MKKAVVIGLVTLLAMGACGKKATPTAPPPPPLTAAEIVEKCSKRIAELYQFHFELDQEGGATPIAMGLQMTQASGDIARPDRLKLNVSATTFLGAITVQIVTVGETTYMTNPFSSQWEPLPNEFTAVKLFDPDTGITAIVGGIREATKLAEEVKKGALSYHLHGKLDSDALRSITAGTAIEGGLIDAELWIGKDDFLLRQIRLEGRITAAEDPGMVRILTLSGFDQPVAIELPK